MSRVHLTLCVLVPFAGGYYLSHLLRSINALIAGDLQADLGLSAADLGALTSTFFLVPAVVVLPLGALLDRHGPRLVDSALLLIAAAGALVFALADGVWTLMLGRALIGLGVAVGLMSGLKAIVMWFPPQHVALANGWYVMLGALGALSATGPAELIVRGVGWRGLFAILAMASAGVALLILVAVPEKKQQVAAAGTTSKIGFLTVFRDPRLWRIAPVASTGVGVSWSLQGLWAAPWLTDVAGLDRTAVVEHLTLMAAVLAAGALLLGALAGRLRKIGISTETLLAGTLVLSMAAQFALLLDVPISTYLLFGVIALAGATTVLSFASLAGYFPKEVSGRANAALSIINTATAFGLQCLAGFIIARWPTADGHYPPEAHQAAMAAGLGLQLIGLAVFLLPRRQPMGPPMSVVVARTLGLGPSTADRLPAHYAAALSTWRRHAVDARRQVTAWRFAAVASIPMCIGLAWTLLLAVIQPAVSLHFVGTGISAQLVGAPQAERNGESYPTTKLARAAGHKAAE